MRIAVITTCAAMLLVLPEFQDPVYAYLDPGTGSMVIQAVVAGFVGAIALGRLYWSRLKGLFKRSPPKDGGAL